jgi:hypothetical protein
MALRAQHTAPVEESVPERLKKAQTTQDILEENDGK